MTTLSSLKKTNYVEDSFRKKLLSYNSIHYLDIIELFLFRESVFLSTLAKPVAKLEMPVGNFTVLNTVHKRIDVE